ncbi:hypothetical protein GWK47_030367 [Chionoecetes opilio]|uniref:Uncharacterized protein n=1 Tax=Chionoecetes opilio TaxID=41210 RepID=A0A8J5CR30_CHIOP|nr:hypothetical protein GWK47_030367 [Chionoecetes opilio]
MVRIDGFPSYLPPTILDSPKDILQYHDESIRKACFTTLSRPFWYLSKDLIGPVTVQLTSPCLSQKAIVQAILYDEGAEEPAKRINPPSSQVPAGTLPSFATKIPSASSKLLISRPTSCPPTLGSGREKELYVEACRRIEGLRVVPKTQPSEEWRSSVLQPPADQRRGTAPVSSSKLWRPIAINSPGPRRLPFPGQAGHNEWGGSP